MNGTLNSFFSIDADSFAAEYLGFLAERVPGNLVDQLDIDGQPDMGMTSCKIDAATLASPLLLRAFPTENLYYFAKILGFIIHSYHAGNEMRGGKNLLSGEAHAQFKMIYVASLYLYCFIRGGAEPDNSGYKYALSIMAKFPPKVDLQGRLQIVRFLASLVPLLPSNGTGEPVPLSTLLLTISLIFGGILSNIGFFTETIMKEEVFGQGWRELLADDLAVQNIIQNFRKKNCGNEISCVSHFGPVTELKTLLSEMFGPLGSIRKTTDFIFHSTQLE